MVSGLPIVALATTEMATVIRNDVSGYADTNPRELERCMRMLLHDRALAQRLGEAARRYALERFSIKRFVADWQAVLTRMTV